MKIVNNIASMIVSNPRRSVLVFMGFNLLLGLLIMLSFAPVHGEATTTAAAAASAGLKYLGAGISTAGSTIGAGIALQGATSAGIAALVEKPEMAAWVLIMAGLGEGIAIYGLIISILILSM